VVGLGGFYGKAVAMMTLQDILDLLPGGRVTKSRDDSVEVQLAWYSTQDNDDTYHTCLECGQYCGILLSNLETATEDRLIRNGLRLCDYCRRRYRNGYECQGVFLTVRES
jgi:hypothetical protein